MTSLLLALLLAAGPDLNTVRVEAALFLPRAGVALAADPIVVYEAQGVVLMPMLRGNQLAGLFDGTSGRFVTSSAASLAAGPTAIMLPMSADDLPTQAGVTRSLASTPDLSGVRVDVTQAQPLPNGARLGLTLGLTQAADGTEPQMQARTQQRRTAEESVFRRRTLRTELNLTYDQPYAVLMDSGQGQTRSLNNRQQIGNQQIELRGALVGVVLHLVQPGAPLAFEAYASPVAPPGHVRVTAPGNRASNFMYRQGMHVSDALQAMGIDERLPAGLTITRLQPNGLLDHYTADSLPAAGSERDLLLSDRDHLTIATAVGKTAPTLPATAARPDMLAAGGPQRGPAVAGMPGMMGGTPAATVQASPNVAQRPTVMPSLSLDELQRVAPAAAQASRAVVALRGVPPGDPPREVLFAGTLVSSDGLVISAPAQTIITLGQMRAQLPDGREVRATLVNTDMATGLALLRLTDGDRNLHGLGFLQLNTNLPPMGTPLVIAGNPAGLMGSVKLTMVAGPRRKLPEAPGAELQLDSALAVGSSGGPIVDLNGRAVAIAFGTLRDGEGDTTPGVGMAVPAEYAARLVAQAKR